MELNLKNKMTTDLYPEELERLRNVIDIYGLDFSVNSNNLIGFLKLLEQKDLPKSVIFWIVFVGNYPSIDENYILTKLLESQLEAAIKFLRDKKEKYVRKGLPRTVLVKAEKDVLLDVTETKNSSINSGIQRITREVSRELIDQVSFVTWDEHLCFIRLCTNVEISRLFNWMDNIDEYDINQKIKSTMLKFLYRIYPLIISNIKIDFIKFRIQNLARKIKKVLETDHYEVANPNKQVEIIFDPDKAYLILELQSLRVSIIERNKVLSEYSIYKFQYLVHDLLPLRMPEFFPLELVGNFSYYASNLVRANRLFVMSKDEYRHLTNYFKAQEAFPTEISLIQPPAYHEFTERIVSLSKNERFLNATILIVGSLEPRKNHLRMLHAIEKVWRFKHRIQVSLVYPNKWFESEIEQKIVDLKNEGLKINLFNSISNEELLELYSKSTVLMYCSLGEGLGLPILEARASKLPVLTSNIGFMKEASTYGGIVTVDPYDVDSMALELQKIVNDFDYWENLHDNASNNIGINWKEYAKQFI